MSNIDRCSPFILSFLLLVAASYVADTQETTKKILIAPFGALLLSNHGLVGCGSKIRSAIHESHALTNFSGVK